MFPVATCTDGAAKSKRAPRRKMWRSRVQNVAFEANCTNESFVERCSRCASTQTLRLVDLAGYAPRSMATPIRRLGLLDVLAIGVNAIVGSGVFSMPDDMHRAMGGWSPLAFLFCALLLMPVALSFAELAGTSDETGGPYLYARKAFGPMVGFIVGWSSWLNAFISWAANTTLFVALCGVDSPLLQKALVLVTIVALGVINYVGVRPGALVIHVMVFGKVTAIVCFVAVALLAAHPGHLAGALPHAFAGVGNGVYLALFPLQGFEVVPVPAGEAKNPERNVPLGTMGSLLFAAVLFVVVQAVMERSYPDIGIESLTPLVDAARHLGPKIGTIVFIGSIVSIGGFTAGSALGAPRYAQAISEHGQLPSALSRIHTRFQTPHVAIVTTTLLTAVLGVFFDYRSLVGFSNVTVVFQYALTCIAVPVLRRKAKATAPPLADEPAVRRFKIPGGPILPIAGAVGSVALLYGSSFVELLIAAGAIGIGYPLALGARRLAG